MSKSDLLGSQRRRFVNLATMLGLALASVNASAAGEQISGVWRIEKPVFAVRTADGKAPPLKPEAAKVYEEHIAMRKAGDTSFDSATWCASVGTPRIMFINYPFKLVARTSYVAFVHEWNWWARTAYVDGAFSPKAVNPRDLPPPNILKSDVVRETDSTAASESDDEGASPSSNDMPGPMGTSLARWQNDTLVIETTQLIDSTLIDSAGMPHSDQLKVTERLRLRSANVLENRIRFEDPETFEEPWETVVTYRRQPHARIQEDVCLDRLRAGEPALRE